MTLVFLSFGTFESAAASPDEQARRQELHNAAQARYDAGDFDGALEQWLRVHDELPPDPALEAYRAVLLHAIASAAEEAHAASGDVAPLRSALAVYERDLDPNRAREDGGISEPDQLRALVERQRSLEAALEAAGGAPDETDEPTPTPAPAPAPTPVESRARPPARTLQLVGGVLLGAGAVSVGVMSWALYRGQQLDLEGESFAMSNGINSDRAAVDDLIVRGERANAVAIATGVIGGALITAGVALLVVGSRGRGRGRRAARTPTLAPALAPGYAGAALHLRF